MKNIFKKLIPVTLTLGSMAQALEKTQTPTEKVKIPSSISSYLVEVGIDVVKLEAVLNRKQEIGKPVKSLIVEAQNLNFAADQCKIELGYTFGVGSNSTSLTEYRRTGGETTWQNDISIALSRPFGYPPATGDDVMAQRIEDSGDIDFTNETKRETISTYSRLYLFEGYYGKDYVKSSRVTVQKLSYDGGKTFDYYVQIAQKIGHSGARESKWCGGEIQVLLDYKEVDLANIDPSKITD